MKIEIMDGEFDLGEVGPWDYLDMVELLRRLDAYSEPAIAEIMGEVYKSPWPERVKLGTLLLAVARRVPELCGDDIEEIVKAWLAFGDETETRTEEVTK